MIVSLFNRPVAHPRADALADTPFGGLFSDPNMLAKLAANPRTQKHLSDPAFVRQVCQLLLTDIENEIN